MIFGVCWIVRKFGINSLYTCPPHLYSVATLPWEIQRVIFQQYYSYILQIIYVISEENKLFRTYYTWEIFNSEYLRMILNNSGNASCCFGIQAILWIYMYASYIVCRCGWVKQLIF